MVYKAEVFGKDPKKNPVETYVLEKENIVEAAIAAHKKVNATKSEEKLRIAKIEEIKGQIGG